MNKDYIMPLMSNSTARHIIYPYVVPRLSLADIQKPEIILVCIKDFI